MGRSSTAIKKVLHSLLEPFLPLTSTGLKRSILYGLEQCFIGVATAPLGFIGETLHDAPKRGQFSLGIAIVRAALKTVGVEGADVDRIVALDATILLRVPLLVCWGLVTGFTLACLYGLAGHDVVFEGRA